MDKIISFAQKGLILNKNKDEILVVKYIANKYNTGKLAGKFGLPGGQINFGESPDESFIREVKEESGITITPSLPFYTWTWIYQKDNTQKQIVAVARIGFYKKGNLRNKPHSESESILGEVKWIELNKIQLKDFILDEQPAIKKFLNFSKTNPFAL